MSTRTAEIGGSGIPVKTTWQATYSDGRKAQFSVGSKVAQLGNEAVVRCAQRLQRRSRIPGGDIVEVMLVEVM